MAKHVKKARRMLFYCYIFVFGISFCCLTLQVKTFYRIKFNLSSIRGTFSFCLPYLVREEVGLSNPYWNLNIHVWHKTRSSQQRCSVRKSVLRNFAKFTGKHLWQSLSFNKRETLAQVFSFEFYEIFKNAFLTEHLWTTASVKLKLRSVMMALHKNKH